MIAGLSAVCTIENLVAGNLSGAKYGSIASIAFYNYYGLSVTKQLSGTGQGGPPEEEEMITSFQPHQTD